MRSTSSSVAAASPRSTSSAGMTPPTRRRSSSTARSSPRRTAIAASLGEWIRCVVDEVLSSDRQQDELSLQAVVEVARHPSPFAVAGLDDARPGLVQLVEAGAQLHGEAFAIECHPHHAPGGTDDLGVVHGDGVEDDRTELLAVELDRRDAASWSAVGIGKLDRATVTVDVAAHVGQPVAHLDRRIAERRSQRILHSGSRTSAAEPRSELHKLAGAGEPPAQAHRARTLAARGPEGTAGSLPTSAGRGR